MDSEIHWFAEKVRAGADGAITIQYYSLKRTPYFRFVERSQEAGVEIQITPGIMPIHQLPRCWRGSQQRCGAHIPDWLREKLESFGEDGSAIREYGLEVVTNLCRELLDGGAPGQAFLYAESGQCHRCGSGSG